MHELICRGKHIEKGVDIKFLLVSSTPRIDFHMMSPNSELDISAAVVVVAATTTRTGPRPTTLALSPNSQEVKRKERVRKRESRAKRKREEAAVAQAQVAKKAARNAAFQKKFRLKKKK